MFTVMLTALLFQQAIQVTPPVQAPTVTFRVSGTVIREDGQSAQASGLSLVRIIGPTVAGTSIAADGSFQFPRVAAGTYQVVTGPTVATEPVMIKVEDKDVIGVRVVIPRVPNLGTPRVSTTVDGGGPLPRYQVTFAKVGALAGTIPFTLSAGPGTYLMQMSAGEYRISITGLPAGYSLKSVASGSANLLNQPLKFAVAETPQISVVLGVSSPPPWVKVSGRVTGYRATEVALINPTAGDLQSVAPRPDGTFEFARVLPGTYDAEAFTTVGSASTRIAVSTGKDVSNIEIKTPAARDVPGRVVLSDPAKPRVAFSVPRPSAANAPNPNQPFQLARMQFTAPTSPDGRFTLTLPEGENLLVFDPNLVPPGFALKSITYGSVDLLSNPIKVAVTDTAEMTITFDSAGVTPVRVSGRINGLKTATTSRIMLVSNATNAAIDAAVNPDGSFVFPRVFPGQYQARFSFNSAQIQAPVNVGTTDKTDVVLNYARQFLLTGQVVMEGLPVDTPPVPVTVEVRRVDGIGNPVVGRSTPVGVLRIMANEGDLTVAVRDVPAGYQVKSFTYGETDLLKGPLKLDDPALWTLVLKIVRQ